jgi:O-antigen ligase
MLPANIIIAGSSIVSLLINYPDTAWTGGNKLGFMGFTVHQNTLGALILFTFPATAASLFSERITTRTFAFILSLLNIYILILSHSRASLLEIIIFVLLLLTGICHKNKRLFLVLITVSVLITIMNFEKISEYVYKGNPEIGTSRYLLFNASFKAALNGGITGQGYGISDPQIIIPAAGSHYEDTGMHKERKRYIREKGNSILAIAEETGIIGAVLFFLPVIIIFYRRCNELRRAGFYKWKPGKVARLQEKENITAGKLETKLVTAIIVAVFIHAQFEAWMVGVSGFQLFFYMLFISNYLVIADAKQQA